MFGNCSATESDGGDQAGIPGQNSRGFILSACSAPLSFYRDDDHARHRTTRRKYPDSAPDSAVLVVLFVYDLGRLLGMGANLSSLQNGIGANRVSAVGYTNDMGIPHPRGRNVALCGRRMLWCLWHCHCSSSHSRTDCQWAIAPTAFLSSKKDKKSEMPAARHFFRFGRSKNCPFTEQF